MTVDAVCGSLEILGNRAVLGWGCGIVEDVRTIGATVRCGVRGLVLLQCPCRISQSEEVVSIPPPLKLVLLMLEAGSFGVMAAGLPLSSSA